MKKETLAKLNKKQLSEHLKKHPEDARKLNEVMEDSYKNIVTDYTALNNIFGSF